MPHYDNQTPFWIQRHITITHDRRCEAARNDLCISPWPHLAVGDEAALIEWGYSPNDWSTMHPQCAKAHPYYIHNLRINPSPKTPQPTETEPSLDLDLPPAARVNPWHNGHKGQRDDFEALHPRQIMETFRDPTRPRGHQYFWRLSENPNNHEQEDN